MSSPKVTTTIPYRADPTMERRSFVFCFPAPEWDPKKPGGLESRLRHIQTLAEEENGYPAVIDAVKALREALK